MTTDPVRRRREKAGLSEALDLARLSERIPFEIGTRNYAEGAYSGQGPYLRPAQPMAIDLFPASALRQVELTSEWMIAVQRLGARVAASVLTRIVFPEHQSLANSTECRCP